MTQSTKQLELLHKIEKDKEDQFASELQSAQSYLLSSQQKLKDVEGFKLEYLKRLQDMGGKGVIGGNYQHYQRFIVQLEEGINKQIEVIETAKQVMQQRRDIWLEQQQKVKAVALLIEKKRVKQQLVIAKEEQNIADEFATQKFIRARMA